MTGVQTCALPIYSLCLANIGNENPKKIRNDIIKGLKGFEVNEVPNRKKAIHTALKNSDPYEIILIAGKGHEAYQDLGKRKD